MSDLPTVLVTGDVTVDHHLYQDAPAAPSVDAGKGVHAVVEKGGAIALTSLIQEAFTAAEKTADDRYQTALKAHENALKTNPQDALPTKKAAAETGWKVQTGVKSLPRSGGGWGQHSYAVWKPALEKKGSKNSVWRAHELMGYGQGEIGEATAGTPQAASPLLEPAGDLGAPRILVLDDGGFLFRHKMQAACWHLGLAASCDWIILKTSAPVAQGDLWQEFEKTPGLYDRLVCVVSAAELRRECAALSCGLSWEKSVEDLCTSLDTNPVLQRLRMVRHLIVNFAVDGALWIDFGDRAAPKAMLVADMGGAEGQFEEPLGKAVGYSSCLTTAIVRELVASVSLDPKKPARPPALERAIAAGLSAMRDLASNGHGPVDPKAPPRGFPVQRLAGSLVGATRGFGSVAVPWPTPTPAAADVSGSWMLVERSQRPLRDPTPPSLLGLARQVVLVGNDALRSLPHAAFGKLFTADRQEIETLRGIRSAMLGYRKGSDGKKPLSIGIFGPPGAGKSFGVRQLANDIFGNDAWLEFNLSQFREDSDDLTGAFHQVRDKVLSGCIPVVFWDEFDSKSYRWLQYLLAPMQDGRFQEGQINHPIGRCVFVFAGATCSSFEQFDAKKDASDPKAQDEFRLAKGPDFASRLDAYYNVLGPNQRRRTDQDAAKEAKPELDPTDVCHPLRRGILIRSMLGCEKDDRIDFDPDLLDALLRVSMYKHGARSLEKTVVALRGAAGAPIRRSSLPPSHVLAMHLDAKGFSEILGQNTDFRRSELVGLLAPAIHENFRELSRKEGWSMHPSFAKPYEELGLVEKEENLAAARRIPQVLALAGLGLEKGATSTEAEQQTIAEHLRHHRDRLAEAEHDGWMAHRKTLGWVFDKVRDDARKLHPAMVPYQELVQADKNKDIDAVMHYPEHVRRAGYRIVFLC